MKKSNKQQKLYFPADIISGGNQLLLVCLKAGVKIAPQIGWMMVNIHKLCRRRLNGNNLHCAILQNTWRGNSLIQMPPAWALHPIGTMRRQSICSVFLRSAETLSGLSLNRKLQYLEKQDSLSLTVITPSFQILCYCLFPLQSSLVVTNLLLLWQREKPHFVWCWPFFEDKRLQSWVFRSNSRSQNMN